MNYPYHGSVRHTLKELFKNDLTRGRMIYMGVAPLMMGMSVLAGAVFASIFVKKLYVAKENQLERREFFSKIDWTQPEKIKKEDVTKVSPQRQVAFYAR